MSSPYIGVTGIVKRSETEYCLNALPANCTRRLMVGLLASSTTVSGRDNTLWNKFPKLRDARNIFIKDRRAFNCFHFASRKLELPNLYNHLMMLLDAANGVLDGIQINNAWPDVKVLSKVQDQSPGLKFILQVSPHLDEFKGMTAEEIAKRYLASYGELADYFLIDYSRGLGVEMDIDQTLELMLQFDRFDSSHKKPGRLVGCGGLCADNVGRLILPLQRRIQCLSWDAEGKLRDESEGGGHLVMYKTVEYIKKSAELSKPIELFSS